MTSRPLLSLILIAPLALFLIALFYTPLALLAYRAFWSHEGLDLTAPIEVLTNPTYISILLFSCEVALITTFCTFLIAYPVALYVSLYSRGFERVALIMLLVTPFWIDVLLRTWSLKSLLYLIGIREGYLAMIIGMIYDYLPFMFIPLAISLMRISESVIEAAKTLGAKPHQVLMKVIVPNSTSGIVVGCLLVFLMSYTEVVIPPLLGGVVGTTVGVAIYRLILEADRWAEGAVLALLVTALGIFVAAATWKLSERTRAL
ncbi:MAG: ABC transporter permease subunit [Acidilobaceae archaeon]